MINRTFKDTFLIDESTECGKHRRSIVERLIVLRLYKECKWTKIDQKKSVKPLPKLKILQNL